MLNSKKKVLNVLLALLILSASLLSFIACSSGGNDEVTTDGEATTEVPSTEESATETTEETTGPETEAPEDYSHEPDSNRLIFFEDFESYSLESNSSKVIETLGWIVDTKENRAYNNNTTKYSIIEKGGSKVLSLENNFSGGTDSYLIMLTSDEMYKYHDQNYTYQFDVTYTGASAADRYIAIVSGYNGIIYNSFHFRNRGSANNQVHSNGVWYTYDASGENYAANTNSNSIVTKLLGKAYNASVQAFTDISVSIRYVNDWDNGNSVYMRVNTEGYPGSGKWTLVSKGVSTAGAADMFKSEWGGAAMVLKTGGRQNGYIDNIIIWEGTGEEPEDKSSPLIK